MKSGLIIINAYTTSEHELNQPQRLQSELATLGVCAQIVRNSPDIIGMQGDFCVYLDKDKYYARLMERRMRLFNRAEAIEICDDKFLTYLALGDIPQPKTIPSLLCYTAGAPVSETLLHAAEKLGYPLVVKECFGSLGKQVCLAHDRRELKDLSEKLQGKPHLFQEFISESAGIDLRVICIGGKVAACMKRTSDNDFRSNAELGGRGETYQIDEKAKALCELVAGKLHLDYCGIDLLFGKEGYLVCEVNSNAFFGTIEKVTGINVAALYARHICNEVYKNAF